MALREAGTRELHIYEGTDDEPVPSMKMIGTITQENDDQFLITFDDYGQKQVWLPKTLKRTPTDEGGKFTVIVPLTLARRFGFM